MNVVVFGDIHGNLPALETLFELEDNFADLYVCHGDIVNYGPWSKECVKLLDEKTNCICLAGNHEDYFCAGDISTKNSMVRQAFEHCYKNFSLELIQLLCTFPKTYNLGDFRITHTIDSEYFYRDTDINHLDLKINHIIGHSHQQFIRKAGQYNLINTGSVGQNREFINVAEYVRIDTSSNKIELRSFVYDISILINKMHSLKFPKICIDYYESKKKA